MMDTDMTLYEAPPPYNEVIIKKKQDPIKRKSFPLYDHATKKNTSSKQPSAYLEEMLRAKTSTSDEEPFNHRLERVSSCLQQMIDEAKASLIHGDQNQKLQYEQDLAVPKKKKRRSKTPSKRRRSLSSSKPKMDEQGTNDKPRQLQKRRSRQRLRESQSKLSAAFDQLNYSLAYHMLASKAVPASPAETSPSHATLPNIPTCTSPEPARTPSPTIQYHHHHHHHHYYHEPQLSRPSSPVLPLSPRPSSPEPCKKTSPKTPRPTLATVQALAGTTLIYSTLHHVCELSKTWSVLFSLAWLLTWLSGKKKSSSLRQQLLSYYSSLLLRFRF
ncbi:hypothetical protein DM01DRAFT_1384188 [Hesseltinella vesiculosa]|uniref:Uncharacterized protein n=1 Tax=Hesseltinella vesiculosa TaxID=101127 RepID=A0A1X2GEF5_9FUNG|nr:hypothetical protein DM01DRAFT_1384188 [Hesseltinella vesiculosa]